jgi:2-polyprenyl-3-methyl-5-hydroxy-6-metoxy-1,4-benzoquinol methylase
MDAPIVTRPQENCPICQQPGNILLRGLIDKLFGTPGKWALQRCCNGRCRSIWINPVIVEEELYKAYANYYTHSPVSAGSGASTAKPGGFRIIYDRLIKQNYWVWRYGYGRPDASRWSKFLGLLVYLMPNKSFYLDTHVMFLPAVRNGRLLDVGCGNGERLELLKQLGWSVKGIDLDRPAVEAAREKGLDTDCGDLKSMNYPADSFDAVIMSHVIEHVPHPRELLTECARVLKPGGRLVMLTPNAESFGLDYYGRCWRGLEPPRHLQIFSQPALEQIVKQAGLNVVKGKSLVGPQVLYASQAIKTGTPMNNGAAKLRMPSALFVKWLTLVESLVLRIKPNCGEILAVIATK